MERPGLGDSAHATPLEDLIRVLLAKRYPRAWLNRLDFESMVKIPDAWVAPRWRCADVVSSIPLVPDGPEPQPTHTVVAVKSTSVAAPEVHERLGRHVALWSASLIVAALSARRRIRRSSPPSSSSKAAAFRRGRALRARPGASSVGDPAPCALYGSGRSWTRPRPGV